MTRSFYYLGAERGYWQLIHLRGPGKSKGITLIPFAQVAAYIRSHGLDSNTGKDSARSKSAREGTIARKRRGNK
jgi:hypothetical protein